MKKSILIGTSLVGRGIDLLDVKLIINYYCPPNKEDYVHRIGRTGRAGSKGVAVTFITQNDDFKLGEIIQAF